MKSSIYIPPPRSAASKERRGSSRNKHKFLIGAAGIVAGISMIAPSEVFAADDRLIAELQAENARLKQELQQTKNQLDALAPPATAIDSKAAAPSSTAAEQTQKPIDEPIATLDAVTVQARDRAEKLQDVPIPVSAISGQALERNNAVTVQDFAKLTPGLLVHAPNARQTSISIRGVGKNTANDALEPSVGVIVDGVPAGFIAQSWGDFSDLDHVEVLRGPQGTLLGKNTTLGVINVVTKQPSFKPESSLELSAGDHQSLGVKAMIGGPIQDGVLAFRASVFAEKRDGPFADIAPDHSNETFQNRDRLGGRLQFLLVPTSTLTFRLSLDRQQSSEMFPFSDPPLIGDPAAFPNGKSRTANNALTYSSRLARPYFGDYKPLIGDWDHLVNIGSRPTLGSSNGVTSEINWTPTEETTLTSITAYRNSLFDAKNAEWLPFDIRQYGAVIHQNQISQEFRINSSLSKTIDYTTGLYLLDSKVAPVDRTLYGEDAGAFYATAANYNALKNTSVGNRLLQDSLRGLFLNTPAHPDTKSVAEFGQLNWHLDEKTTVTLGLRRTDETKTNDYAKLINTDSALLSNIAATTFNAAGNATGGIYNGATAAEIAAAKSVRASQANNLGTIAGDTIKAPAYAWLVNPSYKLNDDILLYTSAGYGEKSGSVQFNTSSLKPQNVNPEKALDFELGAKSTLLNHSLVINGNLYQTHIKDYQQNLTVIDPILSAQTGGTAYRTFLGNAKGVTLRGVEVDGSYAITKRFGFNFSGAYNKAFYSDFANSPCPSDIAGEPGGTQQCDFTGRQLPFAPKLTASLGFDYRVPLHGNYSLHAYSNAAYRGSANYNAGLSDLGLQGSYTVVDGGIGIQANDDKWELALVGKNLGDTHYVTSIGAYSTSGAVTATPGDRRYLGIVLRARQF